MRTHTISSIYRWPSLHHAGMKPTPASSAHVSSSGQESLPPLRKASLQETLLWSAAPVQVKIGRESESGRLVLICFQRVKVQSPDWSSIHYLPSCLSLLNSRIMVMCFSPGFCRLFILPFKKSGLRAHRLTELFCCSLQLGKASTVSGLWSRVCGYPLEM